MFQPSSDRRCRDSGQNLIEVALITPFLLFLALNAINFGYYFFVALNLAAAPRHAIEYGIQGLSTPGHTPLPDAGPPTNDNTVSALAYDDIQNSLPSFGSAEVQVCSKTVGTLTNPGLSTQKAACCTTSSSAATTCTAGTLATGTAPASDPESPNYVLQRVDIVYTVSPLVAGNVFGITVLPSLNFHQQVSMRAMD